MANQSIGLDLKTFSLNNAGIGRYTINLVNELFKRNRYDYVGFCASGSDKDLLKPSKIRNSQGFSNRLNSTVLRSQLFLPWEVHRGKIDLFHSMDNSTINRFPFSRCKRISTIHDVIVFKYPEFFTRKHVVVSRRMVTAAAQNADHIIAVSKSTKNDLLEQFTDLNESKISVVPLAPASIFKESTKEQIESFIESSNIPQRYFLSLGTYEPRKNLKNLIAAFKVFRKNSSFKDIGLVLAGGTGWLDSEVSGKRAELQKDGIMPLGFLEDKFLPHLYSGALAFVYPSFYEGFGLPVVEAMSCGCPVITSQCSSLPEVAGNSALYVDPHSADSIKEALVKVIDDQSFAKGLSRDGLKRSRHYSWTETARKTEEIYGRVLNESQ